MFSRTSAMKSASAPPAVGVAEQLSVAHNGVVPEAKPSMNRVNEVLPITTTPTNAWNGSQSSVEFQLPSDLSKVVDSIVQFEINVTGDAAVALTPTFNWVQRVEVYLDGQVIENVEADELLEQTYFYLTDQERKEIAPLVNINAETGGYASATPVGNSIRYYLPLWSNIIAVTQPYLRGFKQNSWRIKLWFPSSIRVDNGTANVSIATCKLYLTDASLPDAELRRLDQLHMTGIEYRAVIRNKFISPQPSVPYNTQFQVQMTAFTNKTAALHVYIKPNTLDNGYVFAKYAADQIQLRDSNNADLTVLTAGKLITTFQNPWTVPRSTANNSQPNQYIFPFCANLQEVLDTGKQLGGYQLTGNERLVVYPSSTEPITTAGGRVDPPAGGLTNVSINVASFEYGAIVVQNNHGSRVYL